MCIWDDLLSRCWLYSHSKQWSIKDENDHNKEECNTWHEWAQKSFFMELLNVFWKTESWVAYELQKRTNLFCFGSFMFTWPVVTKYLFFFSAKTTVQWYFIVGPLLAVTVLAFIFVKLWKRRIAGTYTVNFASFRSPYQHNKIRLNEINALTAVGPLITLINFTLSDARRFYSSMAKPLGRQRLKMNCGCSMKTKKDKKYMNHRTIIWRDSKRGVRGAVFHWNDT